MASIKDLHEQGMIFKRSDSHFKELDEFREDVEYTEQNKEIQKRLGMVKDIPFCVHGDTLDLYARDPDDTYLYHSYIVCRKTKNSKKPFQLCFFRKCHDVFVEWNDDGSYETTLVDTTTSNLQALINCKSEHRLLMHHESCIYLYLGYVDQYIIDKQIRDPMTGKDIKI